MGKVLEFAVEGDNSLSAINQILSFQESKYCEFKDSKIDHKDGKPINRVIFDFDPDSTVPRPLMLRKHGDSIPTDWVVFWTGVMVVNGMVTTVNAYR
jgi:hypothetical protein